MVVFIHVSAPFLYTNEFSTTWYAVHFIDSLCRVAVPLFLMTTGILLLDPSREITIRKFFLKRFPRILFPFLLWSLIFLTLQNFGVFNFDNAITTLGTNYTSIITTPAAYHLWFVYTLIGLYLLIPIIKPLTKFQAISELKYFSIIWIIFHNIILIGSYFLNIRIHFDLGYFIGYSGFLTIGYLLYQYISQKRISTLLVVLSCMIFFAMIYFGFILVNQNDSSTDLNQYFYEYGNFAVISLAISLFILIRNLTYRITNKYIVGIVKSFGNATFGVFLVHPLIIDQVSKVLQPEIITRDSASQVIIFITVTSLLTVFISYAIVWIISKIPIVKYIF